MGDIVVLHDPQTAGLAAAVQRSGASVVWRCHVGIDSPNEHSERGWEFLRPYIDGVDGSVLSPAAAAIIPTAAEYARDFGLTIWLVSAVDPDARTEFEAAPLHRAGRELKDMGVNVNWDTLNGDDAATAIVDFVATRSSPLLAMTTHGRTGLARITTCSVTMAVVHHAPCPVLVTRSRQLVRIR